MKKRVMILVSIVFFAIGFFVAQNLGKQTSLTTSFATNNILASDSLTLSIHGDISTLQQNTMNQITHNQNLIEPVVINNTFAAVEKTTNYSSILQFDPSGNLLKTLFKGNSNAIDTMSWATDPSVSPDQKSLAFVSDKDKAQTNIPDNALYVLNLTDGRSTNIVQPDPYSGGIAHPVFDPQDANVLLYDYYQYDPQTLIPYSTIEEYDKQSGLTTTLTFENTNAYQASFSPDGKQLLFLGRIADTSVVTMYIADFTPLGLSNIHPLATGDFAYPSFSNTKNHIYYLASQTNHDYNLLTATIQKNILVSPLPVVSGFQLKANSSFSVGKSQ